jgi:hypothetical protein
MSNFWFRRLPGSRREPAGAERVVLRRLPKILVIGSLLLALPALFVRLVDTLAPGLWSAGSLMTTDIYVVSLIILHWTVVLTVAIAAFIVLVMKGPAFVADAYPLDELDTLESTPGKGPR